MGVVSPSRVLPGSAEFCRTCQRQALPGRPRSFSRILANLLATITTSSCHTAARSGCAGRGKAAKGNLDGPRCSASPEHVPDFCP